MATRSLAFSCQCGNVQGALRDISKGSGDQIQCHCDSFRRAVIWLGQDDPGADGVRYYQTSPTLVEIDASQLAAFTWKNEKLLRWYAPCCNTPLFNTLNSPKWAFASLSISALQDQDVFGPPIARAFVPRANGKTGHERMLGVMWGFTKRVLGARLTGTWRTTPFFDDAGTPRARVKSLTHEDRAKAPL